MKYPFVQQSDLKDCGVSCLLMLIRYYGGGVSKEYLRNITNTTKDGVTAYSLIEGAKQLGFSAYGVSGNVNALHKSDLPCIAHVIIQKSYQHFIVIYKNIPDKKKLLIADPSKRKIEMISYTEFEKISTNKFILLKPHKKIEYLSKNTILKTLIYNFVINNSKQIIIILTCTCIITFLNIFNSFQFKFLMEYVISYQNKNNLLGLAFIFGLLILIKEFCSYYRNNLINVLNLKLDKTLFTNLYHHLLSLPYLYYKNRTTGEVVARMNDLDNIKELISKILVTVLLDIIMMFFSFLTLLYLNSSMTIFLLIIVIFLLFIFKIYQKPLETKVFDSKKEGAQLNSFLVETIGGVETIRNCNIQNYIENNFSLKYGKYYKNIYKYNHIFIKEQFYKNIIQECGILFIMLMGSYLVMCEKIDMIILITYITLLDYFLKPIENMIDLHLSWKEAKISLERIHELYEVEEVKENRKSLEKGIKLLESIETKNLNYSYNGVKDILKDINLSIQKGDRVLIYGSSGSGKSTLSKVLSNQLPIKNQMIFYNDKDINSSSTENLKNNICYISQEETLFTDTIYQNIVLDQMINYDDFLNITKLCLIDEFVKDDILQYDMLLEENGFNLSGGQRQRIILARALIRKANIYIFDEALNELDIEKERKILQSLFQNYPEKIFIVISHRFHNQDLFTKKYFIENGVSYEK